MSSDGKRCGFWPSSPDADIVIAMKTVRILVLSIVSPFVVLLRSGDGDVNFVSSGEAPSGNVVDGGQSILPAAKCDNKALVKGFVVIRTKATDQ